MSASRLEIEYLALAALVPYERNARTHSPEQVEQIAASIRAFGWTNPVLVDEANVVIAGHGRLAAARHLGLDVVPVIRLTGLDEQQRRALSIADNKLALNAGWNETLLAAELQSLGEHQSLVGFSTEELLRLFARGNPGLTDPDEVPEPPAEPVTRPGDVWHLGPHRLVCGDATNAADVALALAGVTPHLMATDPPYGVDYDPAWRHRAGLTRSVKRGRVRNDERADWREAWAHFAGNVAYVWHGGLHAATVAESLEASGFKLRAQIIWAKDRLVLSRGDYHWQHEPCWYAVREHGHWEGDRKQTTVWHIANRFGGDTETEHATQKPVECMRRPIENNSLPGQPVYDPFVGSGTTIIAAEITGRVCHAIELEPAWCDVAAKRWENFTGRKAERRALDAAAA